jgi:hypothetical protein
VEEKEIVVGDGGRGRHARVWEAGDGGVGVSPCQVFSFGTALSLSFSSVVALSLFLSLCLY